MTHGLLLKGAALVVFLGVLGGATYGVQSFLGEDATAALALQVEAPRATVNATAGHAVTYPVVVHNRGEVAMQAAVRATGASVEGATEPVLVPARSNETFFLTVQVLAEAEPGARKLTLAVLDAAGDVLRQRGDLLELRVLAPSVGFQEGDVASLRYTGRVPTGEVFDTNDPFVYPLKLRSTAGFSPHGSQPLRVDHANPRVITGFFEGIQGMQPGESRTITFPPEKGYGPDLVPQELDREERLDRVYDLELGTDAVGREVFDDYVTQTEQGDPASFRAGDVFRFEQGPNRWPYRIVSIDESQVEYRLDVKVGENYTLFPFWEGASLVESVNETHARFVTTPTTAVDAPFTMRTSWPDMSAVVALTDETIVVRHSPPVGFKFSQSAGQMQPAQEAVVQEVTEDRIVIGVRSDNPLAGQALTFDVEMLEITR